MAQRVLLANNTGLVGSARAGGTGFHLRTKGKIKETSTCLGFERVDSIRHGFHLLCRGEWRVGSDRTEHLCSDHGVPAQTFLPRYGPIPAEAITDAIRQLFGLGSTGRRLASCVRPAET